MCELFGVTSSHKIKVNDYLKEFFSHSKDHPNGWGMAVFQNGNISVEKEPITASYSLYLKNRLTARFEVENMLAHIRYATIGDVNYVNTHPFARRDESGRTWTLIHNGTIFDAPCLTKFQHVQEGNTDSERILLYIVSRLNKGIVEELNGFDVNERFKLIESIFAELAPENKLNIILYDGEYMYVHKNAEKTLYVKERNGTAVFSTVPLDDDEWKEFPLNRLIVYKDGNAVYEGTAHDFTYLEDPVKLKTLFMGYAGL